MNEKTNFTYKKLSPFKWFVLENFPFLEADFDALTEWQLFCKLGKEINKIIESQNLVGKQAEELTNAFNDLQNYVNNYFENLDVQEEINNKLNEMAEDGTLQEIIEAYINLKSVLAFDTVTDMKQASNLVDGSFVKTYGKTTLNDGKGRFYKIREIINTDIVDNENIIALNNPNLVAVKMISINDSFITPEIFGAKGNETTDDTIAFQNCIDFACASKLPIFAFKNYLISNTLNITNSITIFGSKNKKLVDSMHNMNDFTFIFTGENYLFSSESEYNYSLFENITIKGNSINNAFKNQGYRNIYNNVAIYNCSVGIDFVGEEQYWRGENEILNCYFEKCGISIKIQNTNYADSHIRNSIFVGEGFAIKGSFNAWSLTDSHDYSIEGIEITHLSNAQISNNYFDKSSKLPFIKASIDYDSGALITNNKFLTGNGIENVENSLIEINNNIGSNLVITNNVGSGTKYSNVYFVKFTGRAGISFSFSNNQMFKIVGKLLKGYPLNSAGSLTNYGGYRSVENISGNVNFNQCYFNNGIATIILEVAKAGITLGHLPFNPALSVRIPVYSIQKNSWGSALLNNTNGNITIPNNFTGDTVLINASYMVYYNGDFGD